MVALALIAVVVVLIILISRSSSPTIGYDASYPQCSGSYPSNPLFGIVGVNGGVANNANRCISDELHWARDTPGQKRPKQPPLSLYIDTGNPGGHHVADWPSGGTAPTYGSCNGKLTNACSYLYGEQRAAHSYRLVAALDSVSAKTAPWWLDVELLSSWAGTYELNIAALQGFIAGLRNAGATGPIGIYSTSAPMEGHHRADGADDTDRLPQPAARLGGRNGGHAHAGAAELHERWLHRRRADARAVPDRSARRRPALHYQALTHGVHKSDRGSCGGYAGISQPRASTDQTSTTMSFSRMSMLVWRFAVAHEWFGITRRRAPIGISQVSLDERIACSS